MEALLSISFHTAESSLRTGVHARIADIPDSSTLDHVTDGEALDRLVLAHATRAVRAAHELDVATALLVAAVVSSLLGLQTQIVVSSSSLLLKRHPRPRATIHPILVWISGFLLLDSMDTTRRGVLTILDRVSCGGWCGTRRRRCVRCCRHLWLELPARTTPTLNTPRDSRRSEKPGACCDCSCWMNAPPNAASAFAAKGSVILFSLAQRVRLLRFFFCYAVQG